MAEQTIAPKRHLKPDPIIDLIRTMVESVVDDPMNIFIDVEDRPESQRYLVSVAAGNIGQAVGRGGRMAGAIRLVAKSAAMKDKLRVYVEIDGEPAPVAQASGS